MKNIALVLSLVFAFNHSSKAQFRIGLNLAPGISYMRGNMLPSSDLRPAVGFAGLINYQYNFDSKFALSGSIGFEQKGAAVKMPMVDINGVETGHVFLQWQFRYAMVPLLARLYAGEKKHFFIDVGGYYGYLLQAMQVNTTKTVGLATFDFTTAFKRADYGFSGGFGISFPISKHIKWESELRHNIGIPSIMPLTSSKGYKLQTNSVNVFFGISYLL